MVTEVKVITIMTDRSLITRVSLKKKKTRKENVHQNDTEHVKEATTITKKDMQKVETSQEHKTLSIFNENSLEK